MTDSFKEPKAIGDCDVCKRSGLPILPMRYAVARNDGTFTSSAKSLAPEISGPFVDDSISNIPLPQGQNYTLRLLREGYLYVFDEAKSLWSWYFVTEKGYLIELASLTQRELNALDLNMCQMLDGKLQPPENIPEFACAANAEHSYPGRCLMIKDPENSTNIYMSFSDSAWTKRLWKEFSSNTNGRRDTMRKISLSEWKGGNVKYADNFEKIEEYLSESRMLWSPIKTDKVLGWGDKAIAYTKNAIYSLAQTSIKKSTFGFSPYPFNGFKDRVEGFISWAKKQTKNIDMNAMIVSVDDPVGITVEIATLMAKRLHEHVTEPKNVWPLATSSAIDNIKSGIYANAEEKLINDRDNARKSQIFFANEYAKQDEQDKEFNKGKYDKKNNPTPEELINAKRKAWDKYISGKLDESSLRKWNNNWDEELKKVDNKYIIPLVKTHLSWFQSENLYEHLNSNYDDQNIESGNAFVNVVTACIQNTQSYNQCKNKYAEWLGALTIEKKNIILRALGYNQKKILEEIEKTVNGGLQPDVLKGLPWDQLITGYDNSVSDLGQGGQNAIIRLTAALGGPFAKVAGEAVDHLIGPGLVAMGIIAKAPVILAEGVMSKTEIVAEITAKMIARNPKISELGVDAVNKAIEKQLRKLAIYGVEVKGTGKFKYLVTADPRVVDDFPGANSQRYARKFAEDVLLTDKQFNNMTRLRWQRFLPTETGLGLITGILQIVALTKLSSDLNKSMDHEKTENEWRFGAGIAGLVGTLSEGVGTWAESAATAGNRFAITIERYLGFALRITGKVLGIAAGIITAAWDFYDGFMALQENNSIGYLYIVSGSAASLATVAFLPVLGPMIFGAAATGVGIVLVVFVIIIAVLIEFFKDDAIQDWIERCYFHADNDGIEPYKTMDVELKNLKIALEK